MSREVVAGPSRSRGIVADLETQLLDEIMEDETSTRSGRGSDQSGESSGTEDGTTTFNQSDNCLSSYVLASVIKRGMMSANEIKAVIQRACAFFKFAMRAEYSTLEGIQNIIRQINQDIGKYNLILRSVHCEITGKKFYTVRVDKHSAMTKFQTEFKKSEIAIINECVQAMLNKNKTLSIPLGEGLAIARKHTKSHYTYAEGRNFYRKLMKMAYFVKSTFESGDEDEGDDYNYSLTLGCRALEEFLGVLQENYPGLLKSCKVCSQPMLHGYECSLCGVSTHRHCCEAYIKASQVCPGGRCNAKWTSLSSLKRRTFHLEVTPSQSQSSGVENTVTATTTETEEEMN